MLRTRWFYADEAQPLVEQVNAFLATLPVFRVKDVQFTPGRTCDVGENKMFAAWVIYEVPLL